MKAYVLITIQTGGIHEVIRHLNRLVGVHEASMTFGPYDAVAVVEADSIKDMGEILATKIQPIPGIIDTITCLAIEE